MVATPKKVSLVAIVLGEGDLGEAMAVSLARISIHSRVETDICCHDTVAPLAKAEDGYD